VYRYTEILKLQSIQVYRDITAECTGIQKYQNGVIQRYYSRVYRYIEILQQSIHYRYTEILQQSVQVYRDITAEYTLQVYRNIKTEYTGI